MLLDLGARYAVDVTLARENLLFSRCIGLPYVYYIEDKKSTDYLERCGFYLFATTEYWTRVSLRSIAGLINLK